MVTRSRVCTEDQAGSTCWSLGTFVVILWLLDITGRRRMRHAGKPFMPWKLRHFSAEEPSLAGMSVFRHDGASGGLRWVARWVTGAGADGIGLESTLHVFRTRYMTGVLHVGSGVPGMAVPVPLSPDSNVRTCAQFSSMAIREISRDSSVFNTIISFSRASSTPRGLLLRKK